MSAFSRSARALHRVAQFFADLHTRWYIRKHQFTEVEVEYSSVGSGEMKARRVHRPGGLRERVYDDPDYDHETMTLWTAYHETDAGLCESCFGGAFVYLGP